PGVEPEPPLQGEMRVQLDHELRRHEQGQQHEKAAPEALHVHGVVEPVSLHQAPPMTARASASGTSGRKKSARVAPAVITIAATIGSGASPWPSPASPVASGRKNARYTMGRK